MAMMTGKEYIESLRELKPDVHFMGERITNVVDEPMFQPHINTAAMTYELANDPRYEEVMTATSHLTGEKINRFTHIHQSTDDLVKKVRMMRLLGQRTGTCFQRCVGLDALNAIYATSYDIDQKKGTEYHERFKNFLKHVQEKDLMSAGAMTDPRGDRSLRPNQQKNPNIYLRIHERNDEGIIVNGAKAHITGVINSHEIIVLPTRAMGEEDKDYALSFAVPVDTKGIKFVFARQTNDTRRLQSVLDAGNPKYAIVGGEAIIIFKDVFIPWQRVFMAGEYEFAGQFVETFAGHHRANYGGCKVGLADVVTGGAQWVADAHGVAKASHIIDKLTEMIAMAETCWSCSLACSYEGHKTPSGSYNINPMLANVTKLNITRMVYEWMRLAHDIAGGKIITLPAERDFNDPEVGETLAEYFEGKEGVDVKDILKMLRLVENMSVGAGLPEAMHGAGSPAAQKIMIARRSGIEKKREFAEIISGIRKDESFEKIVGKSEEEYWQDTKEKIKSKRVKI
ncbi:MAG: 4-hydroxyphenylacetate 3-hydroxylase family protein [Deltaproteobacteria bacterium]|nr:4-hydroxyphenylacetate 3-hydroxylase family protein [Deltaproteobacteria bacterium]